MPRFSILLSILLLILHCQPLFGQETAVSVAPDESRALEYYIQGITDFENEDYEQALDNLTAAHLKLSEHAGVNYALSDVYLATGDLSNAAYYGQIAATIDPENKWYHLHLARINTISGRTDAAIEALNKALEYHPNDQDILYRLAETYTEFGQLLEANRVYDQLLKLNGRDFNLHLQKFRNFNALQMRDSAMAQLEIMRDLNPGNLSTLHNLSQFYLELDDEESAREILMEARERNARDPQTLILLADIYIRNNEWQNLGDTFISMLNDPLIYPSQKLELARFLYLQYQQKPQEEILKEQAGMVITRFAENEPDYEPAQSLAADFYLQTGDYTEALDKLEQINQLNPEEPDAWRQRMQVLFSLQRYDEVIGLSEEVNEKVPDDAAVQFFTGASYMVKGDPESALVWLEQATLAPSRRNFRSVVYGTLADVYQDLDRWDDAVNAYEQALRLDSSNHNAMNNYAYYLSVRGERLEDALELAESAIEMDPENASYLDTIGWIHFKLGNLESAKEYIIQAVETCDAGAEVFEHLGDIYEALNDPENARKWWLKAADEDSSKSHLNDKIKNSEL